ncbi:diguanylate cyclase [Azorhizobium doebereinerae]|uniref:diguanylate cyclase n=1 Tax=Azorhizobium doebereinerae TaxID=281091 RepID=UPI0004298E07|nr:diguanylate cyclase [Azorhizobium doebereinerae]
MQIVLVDASRVTLKLMTKMLHDNGHEVAAFGDGTDALAHLHSGAEVDVLMTSFEIPGISGLQLCWEARLIANAGRPLYVIAMSSNTDIGHLVEALDSGADDFVSKPPALPELYARLRAAERMNQAQRELVRLATRDFLTGLFNRRAFFFKAEELIRNRVPASVLLLDIDYFKHVNDTYGHDGGDLALIAVAKAISAYAGRAARVGGEEFAILLPEISEADAYEEAERLRFDIANTAVMLPGNQEISITISIGVAERDPDDNVDEWVKRSDVALYAAKTGGRNRSVMAEDVMAPDAPSAGLARSGGGRGKRAPDPLA